MFFPQGEDIQLDEEEEEETDAMSNLNLPISHQPSMMAIPPLVTGNGK